jgi:hypothetical protein
MARYRVHFITHADDIFGTEFFDSESDELAKAYSCSIYRSGVGKGFELWQDHRHVHTEIY